jgi:hypothetical protein
MVLMSGKARHTTKIITRTNTCGGVKKAGLPTTIGNRPGSVLSRVGKIMPMRCVSTSVISTQKYGYHASH